MKILYLPSGYVKVYKFFNQCIMNELHSIENIEATYYEMENGITGLKALCGSFKPTVLLTLVGDNLPIEIVIWLKKNGVKPVLWLTEDPYFMDKSIELIPYYDHVFTIDKGSFDFYQEQGYHHVELLSLGTDCDTFTPKPSKNIYASDIALVGYPYPDRVKLIKKIAQNTNYKILVCGTGWRKKVKESKQLKICKGWFPPKKVATLYSSAKIVLNPHRHYQEHSNENSIGVINESINNRTFDIAACGTFQLIEHKEDLATHFVEGVEMISYQNEKDLLEKLDFYLRDNFKRGKIGENARKRVLNEHTFYHRIQTLVSKIIL
ncbi:CgeB family protein [Bacillus sp. FJAT-45350]|uniref:CgeB family protein n=1 Tax=Bacillus sp. FJAT-45350 TaxID=2011014 RepID=UPI000BB8DC20|nr:glycosyltransferase [Bacillus sp. FJAT-45350]